MKRLASTLAVIGTLLVSLTPLFAGTVAAGAPTGPGNQHFNRTWQRTDLPVADLLVSRTWMWGPEGQTGLMTEEYLESPGGERTVQYFDKSRMEITHPDGDASSVWYVTNGLLVVELITGQMQIGDNTFQPRLPAEAPVAGDGNDPNGPTYATFSGLLLAGPKPVGDLYTERVSRSGQVSNDPTLAARDVRAGHFDEVTQHTIAEPFWSFMNSRGTVYESGQFIDALLFENPLFATGRPVTEAYWAEVLIAGTPTDVLMQCFERRCLTFNPSNPAGWQVEAGNVGIHYYEWRYGTEEDPGNGSLPPGAPDPGNDPPSDPGPGDPPPGDPPPGDPPPDDPGNPPPGNDPPPGEPPNGDVPEAPYDLYVEGRIGGADGPYVFLRFSFGDQAGPPVEAANQATLAGLDDPQADGFNVYRQVDGSAFNLIRQLGPGQLSIVDESVDYGHRYCYYITAVNQAGESAATETRCGEVPHRPDAPRLLNPVAGYTTYDREVVFSWEPVNGATAYVLCIFKPEAVPTHCDFDAGVDTGQQLWTGATDGLAVELRDIFTPDGERTELYWTVAACVGSAYDCGGVAEYRQFYVDLRDQLAAPILDRAEGDPNDPGRFTFYWHLANGAATYQICLFAPGADCAVGGGQTYMSSPLGPTVDVYPMDIPLWLAPDGQITELRWTVGACDANNDCAWQQNYQVIQVDRSNQQLAAPTLVSPSNGYVTSDSPLYLEWAPVSGAASYRVCLAYDAGDSCPYNQTFWSSYLDPSTTTWAVYNPDNTYTELEWTVAACDAANNCVWQESPWTVTIDRLNAPLLDAPTLVSPHDGYQTADRRIVFEWNGVTGAETYVVCAYVAGGNCENDTGGIYKSATLGPGVRSYPLTIPVHIAPDDVTTDLYWTVGACDANNNCAWQASYLWIVLSPDMEAPELVGPNAGYETTDRRVVFEWNLAPDATSYQICVALPGENCRAGTAGTYKSSVLGPAVTSYPLDIPYWLAPDGERTQINWVVAACYANGNCVWQMQDRAIYVDLR